MSRPIRILPEPVRTLGFASIGAGYMGVGTAISHPARILFIQNLTDQTLMFSLNGIDDHFPLPGSGFLLLDVTANKIFQAGAFVSEGTRLYVKDLGVAPGSGSVYFTVFYGAE
jgi:hypothetical protein